jgi:hypothetical protein
MIEIDFNLFSGGCKMDRILKEVNIVKQSKDIFDRLNIKELRTAGIEREDIKVSSQSHHIVTYPPLQNTPEIDPFEVYSFNSKKSLEKMIIYLHLPFCTGKCLYCA